MILRISRGASVAGGVLVLGSAVVFALWGAAASLGYFFGGTFSLCSFLATRRVLGLAEQRQGLVAPARLQLLLVAKAGVFLIVIFFTSSLGLGALYGLLGGYVLVYLAAFGGLLGRRPAPVSSDKER